MHKRFGWIPSFPRPVPEQYKFSAPSGNTFSPKASRIDLRDLCPPVYDQSNQGSCVAHVVVGAVEFERLKQGKPDIRLSRQEVYNLGRNYEGNLGSDAGMQIHDGMLMARANGIAPESEYPYNKAKLTEKPPNKVIHDGLPNKALNYLSILQDGTPLHIRHSLELGFPVCFGFTVYDSFMSDTVAQTGDVPMPNPAKEVVRGGHAVIAVGFDDSINKFIVRNSWGVNWGKKGYFLMPYDYVCSPDYSSDLWSVRLVA